MSAIQSELPGMQQETRQFKPFTKSKANSNKQKRIKIKLKSVKQKAEKNDSENHLNHKLI